MQTDSTAEIGGTECPRSFSKKQGRGHKVDQSLQERTMVELLPRLGDTGSPVSLETGKHIAACPVLCWGKD